MKYFLSTLILVSAAPALAAQTEGPKSERLDRPPHQQQGRARGQRGESRQRGGEERQRPSKEEVLKRFDANGDGKLDETEKARLRAAVEARRSELGKRKKEGKVKGGRGKARRQQLLQRFDANGDGQLNEQERQALKTAMEQRRAAQGEQRPQRRSKRQPQSR